MLVKDLIINVDMENGNTVSLVENEFESILATAEEVRSLRNKLLEELVDKIPGSAVRWSLMSEEEKLSWVNYRQALLDLPEQEGFPTNVIWPTRS
jgi:hypothetical protein